MIIGDVGIRLHRLTPWGQIGAGRFSGLLEGVFMAYEEARETMRCEIAVRV
jgi:hypothetical protein